jgi:hypothetical protein
MESKFVNVSKDVVEIIVRKSSTFVTRKAAS